ncbi:hypothetical protein K7X08_004822 [Anisodus acutangulus]|uniref:XRCC4 N-terminal domain-containing protein n=1 Tax=Anisodus acutangulus TaxID=402998 RepID=A0A9Q1MEC1_9SOLA|nr:hypothetical protein K7X08_004822 [Anisodus acutangulus]
MYWVLKAHASLLTLTFSSLTASKLGLANASEEEVEERASQWDQPVSEYIDLGEKYLRFQQPGSVYGFDDAGSGHKRDEVVSKTQVI